MKRIISNRLSMYGSVQSTLNSNQTAWSNIPALAEAVAQFTQKLTELNTELIKVDGITNGVKASRDLRVDAVRTLITRLIHALKVYARVAQQPQLLDHYGFPMARMKQWSIGKLHLFAASMISDLETYGSELLNYGITQDDLDQLPGFVQQMPELASTLRSAVIDRAAVNGHIAEIDREMQRILQEQIDPLVEVIGQDHPDFIAHYRRARHLIDRGHIKHSPPLPGDQAA